MSTLPATASPSGPRSVLGWLPLVAAGALLAACDGDPPVACGTVEEQVIYAGNELLVEVCFQDPDGQPLTFAAASSDDKVATAVAYRRLVNLMAESPGSATITVTAEDPGGNTASVDISVVVPNQAPVALGTLPNVRMLVGGIDPTLVNEYFSDPDGQPLEYSAGSDDSTVASARIEDSIKLVVRGLSLGTANVTVTATDPGGLTATRETAAEVLEPEQVFRDEMDANGTDWSFNEYTDYRFADDYLYLSNQRPNSFGSAERDVDVAEWEFSASMGIDEGDEPYTTGLWSYAPSQSAVVWLWASFGEADDFVVGETPGANYRIFYYCCYTTEPDLFGNSDAVNVAGEFTEMVLTSRNGTMTLAAGETILVTIDLIARDWSSTMETARLITFGPDGSTGVHGKYDWAELWGIAVEPASDGADASAEWRVTRFDVVGVAPPGGLAEIGILKQ